ncbi:MAG: hypothetical protein WCW14_04245, partial [Candidatus Paceibacterota bacterium]
MNIGIILSFKESMRILASAGQESRFVDYYMNAYAKNFDKIFVFSWEKEIYKFPQDNVILIPNKYGINKYLYIFLLPFIEYKVFKKVSILRLTQFTAIISALIVKSMTGAKIIATYGFPYGSFLKVQGKFVKYYLWDFIESF